MAKWQRVSCYECDGHGVVSDYGNGEDFYGAKECNRCGGVGTVSISNGGAIAQYPGGPLIGRLTKQEMSQRILEN